MKDLSGSIGRKFSNHLKLRIVFSLSKIFMSTDGAGPASCTAMFSTVAQKSQTRGEGVTRGVQLVPVCYESCAFTVSSSSLVHVSFRGFTSDLLLLLCVRLSDIHDCRLMKFNPTFKLNYRRVLLTVSVFGCGFLSEIDGS